MNLTCPECKNKIDLADKSVEKDQVIECNMCGITLMVTNPDNNGEVAVEIVDEGK